MAELIPLFPLSHVLLPGMPLPLHIFEARYRELLDDLAGAPRGASFGVVALRAGTEAITAQTASGPPDVEPVGTLAEILEHEPRTDGSSDVLAIGSRRFRVHRLRPDGKPYLRAEVEFLDERDGPLEGREQAAARRLLERYDALLLRVAGRTTGAELPEDANQLSYQIAARLPLPPAERQALLDDPTTAERLTRLVGLLRRETALLRATRSIAVSPAVLRMAPAQN